MPLKTALIKVKGTVQGVGFRPFVYRAAVKHSITGTVRNLSGSVIIEASGRAVDIKEFYASIIKNKPVPAIINEISIKFVAQTNKFRNFKIIKSKKSAELKSIPPDIRVCPQCLDEFNDINNRRFHYPFINCTNCGPRFTIIKDTPYDRENTSMKDFVMCEDCGREYLNMTDRRYHAEPNACPKCGPKTWLADPQGNKISTDSEAVFIKARQLLKNGGILAVKGLGGFHIAVDASNEKAVLELKRRKKRSDKPFAVMADSIGTIRGFAEVGHFEAAMLADPAAPVVLLKKKGTSVITDNAAKGLEHIGVFLPYTPLHYLLFDGFLTVLVMTSANIAEEPIQYDNKQALKSLSGIADYFLFHDRNIVIPADDSVLKPYASSAVFIRRSRGYVPAPLILKKNYLPVIGTGPLLKNTVCFLAFNYGIMSQHIGDLENKRAYDYFKSTVNNFLKFYGIKPKVIACDKHPDYLTTRFAIDYSRKAGIPLVQVQHHYAHMLSVMAEHGHYSRAIGVILDGTGYGDDGNTWGGEIFTGDFSSYERKAHFKYLKLAGGDLAAKQCYRPAISVLSSFLAEKEIIKTYSDYAPGIILQSLKKNINTSLSSGAGRLFEAAASILNICHESTYDAEAPMKLEAAAHGIKPTAVYEYDIVKNNGVFELDLAPAFKDLWRQKTARTAAANFHATICAALIDAVSRISAETGIKDVVLSGGVFQNTIMLESVFNQLKKLNYNVLIHVNLSPNDSSIALGQAVYAAENLKT